MHIIDSQPGTTQAVETAVPHPPRHAGRGDTPRNLQIQWLRAVAAFTVVVYHASAYAGSLLRFGGFATLFDGRCGLFGVSLFFAISGYLMATAIRVQAPATFLSHRIVRIYPVFLAVYAGVYAVRLLAGTPFSVDFDALLLVPAGAVVFPLQVEWTLVFEVSFYVAIFAIGAMGWVLRLPWIALGWLAVLAIASGVHPDDARPGYLIGEILFSSACVPLAGGLMIPTLLRRHVSPALWITAGAASCCLQLWQQQNLDHSRWLYGIGATLILAGVVGLSAKRPSLGDNALGRAFARGGDYSYALYLCHVPVILAVYRLAGRYPPRKLWFLAIAAALLAGAVVGKADMTVYKRLKAALTRASLPFVRNVTLAYLLVFALAAFQASYARHAAQRRLDEAHPFLQFLAGRNAVLGPQDAAEAATEAGLARSDAILGNVELAERNGGELTVRGWAADTGKQHEALAIALFQGGRLIGSGLADLPRRDVQRVYHHAGRPGYLIQQPVSCSAGAPVIALAFTATKRFSVLPSRLPPPC